MVLVPGRGEVFVREAPGRPGDPVILLLHGWTATADLNWFQVYERVAGLGHVVAVDHRSHGRSLFSEVPFQLEDAADDAAGVLDVLGLGPAVAVGYSMGGPIASLLAQRHPDKIEGLVLCATALEWHDKVSERAWWRAMRGLQILFRLGPPRHLVERYMRKAIEETPELAPVRGWLVGELRRGDAIGVHQAGLALGRYDARPWIGALGLPASVVLTTKDRLVPPAKQRALARAVSAHVVELKGDHDACVVKPGQFGEALTTAITSVLDRRAHTDRQAVEAV
ncbi:MAG: hypothetical protein QOK43_2064 [Acidimicrobiaceae bacterium]|nr:hypothetical protein [Acidimicrobiaceae bacterium]